MFSCMGVFDQNREMSIRDFSIDVDLLQPIHNCRKLNVASGIQKVVLPIKVDMLPAHRTNAFDLIGLLMIPSPICTLQQFRQYASIVVDDTIGK